MLRPGGSNSAAVALLVASACALACDGVVEPGSCALPEVVRSNATANPHNVLSAMIMADVHSANRARVRFGIIGAPLDSVSPSFEAHGDSVRIPLFGLHARTQYDIQLVAFNECGSSAGAVLSFSTDTLPGDLPRYIASGSDPSPGYVVFAAGRYGVVIDNTGRIVWYHRFPNGPGLNFQAQLNGRYAARPSPTTPGEIARWVEIDPLGETTRTLGCARGLTPRMHDLLAQADGSYWVLCDEVRAVNLSPGGRSPQTPVLGTVIQHISAAGDVLFDWSAFNHLDVDLKGLDAADLTGAVINWTHGNALDLDSDGNLIVSFRNLSEVTKIDAQTGAVVWRLGGQHNQFTFENVSTPAFSRQHGVRATGAGMITMLDNLGDPRSSRAERYEYDEVRRTVRLSSSYPSSTRAIAQMGGTTQSLSGGRTLVSFGSGGSVEESDAAGNVVWRLEGNPGYVFRAQRIRSLYQPGVGDPR